MPTRPGRWQAAAALAPELDAVLVEGGYDGNFTPKNEVWLYDLAKNEWRDLGKGHKATDAHAAMWDAETASFLVHGGATASKHALEGVWAFDPKKKRWKELATTKGEAPGPRDANVALAPSKCQVLRS